MPELPEVETFCRILKKNIKGKKITNCRIYFNKIIKYPIPEKFIQKIINQTINNIKRMGKYLLFILDDYVLISHLRMEGKYYICKKEDAIDWKHIMVIFELDNKYYLYYNDTRRFGTMHLYYKKEYLISSPLNKLGLEPFDKNITVEYLQKNWKNKNQPIKTILLKQNVIVGIGNIYANEILFMSNINPGKKTKNLINEDYQNIIKNTIKILKKAIKYGGTTIATYHPELRI